jgi:hypothetical protein
MFFFQQQTWDASNDGDCTFGRIVLFGIESFLWLLHDYLHVYLAGNTLRDGGDSER